MEYAEELCQMLRDNELEDVVFLVGGTIPDEDAERLKQIGVTEVFGPGTPTRESSSSSGSASARERPDTKRRPVVSLP